MPARLTLALGALLCALFACTSPAFAATQTKDDAGGEPPLNYIGERTDLRQATWDVTADTVTLDLTMTNGYLGRYYVFLDTNKDGKSDYAIQGNTGKGAPSEQDEIDYSLETTPQSTADCQRSNGPFNNGIWTGSQLAAGDHLKGDLVGDARKFRISFPTSMIGGAQTFDWAVYGYTFDIFNDRFDYMPDGTNYDVNRQNPVSTVKDYCDDNGDGVHSDNGDTQTSQSGFVPLVMAEGFTFPDESPATGNPGGGNPGGGQGGSGSQSFDTTVTGQMPKVTKLRVDQAKERVSKAIGFADFDIREVNLPKPPKGTGFGDVVEQKPAAGTPLTGGFGQRPMISLDIYAGPKPTGSKDCLDKLAKEVKGIELAPALDLLKKAGCRVSYDFKLGGGDKEVVSKVTPRAKDNVELQVLLPADAKKQNLFLNVRENPNQLSFDAPRPNENYPGFNLLSSSDQNNCMTIQVVDRHGYFVEGANVRLDTSDVGAPRDPNLRPTDRNGETQVCALLPKAGRLDIVTWAVGKNDVAIYGGHSFNVVNGDKMKTGTVWNTSSGRVLVKHPTGKWVVQSQTGKAVHGAAAGQDYGPLVNWLISLFSGNNTPAVNTLSEPTVGSGTKLLNLCGGKNGSCPAILAVGNGPVGKGASSLISVGKGQVVSAGGGNVVSAGGGNVVSAGGLNLVDGAKSGVVSAGGANVVSAGGGNVVSAGGANIASTYGGGLISDNGLGLISDNGLGLISDNGLGLKAAVGNGLISFDNAKLISDNGLG